MLDSSQLLVILAIWSVLGIIAYFALRHWLIRQQVHDRLRSEWSPEFLERRLHGSVSKNFLTRWLYVSGFREPSATLIFLLLTMLCLSLGAGFVTLILWSGVATQFADLLRLIPGGVGEVFLPIAWISPWCGGLLLTTLPTLYVRSARRKRIQQIEQDLPLQLDLLATLAEAGLSFDSALDRILEAQTSGRPLAEDFRLFQVDILAGRARVEALRRLMQRVDVTWFSIFVSALMHAEQVGSSLASTLRTQADDLRMRRRERALAMAMAIPVKLLVPLIVCFLPGIMTAALGPVLYQIVQVLDSFLRGSLGQ